MAQEPDITHPVLWDVLHVGLPGSLRAKVWEAPAATAEFRKWMMII